MNSLSTNNLKRGKKPTKINQSGKEAFLQEAAGLCGRLERHGSRCTEKEQDGVHSGEGHCVEDWAVLGSNPSPVYLCLTLAITSPLLLPAQGPGPIPATACCQKNGGTAKDEGFPASPIHLQPSLWQGL